MIRSVYFFQLQSSYFHSGMPRIQIFTIRQTNLSLYYSLCSVSSFWLFISLRRRLTGLFHPQIKMQIDLGENYIYPIYSYYIIISSSAGLSLVWYKDLVISNTVIILLICVIVLPVNKVLKFNIFFKLPMRRGYELTSHRRERYWFKFSN